MRRSLFAAAAALAVWLFAALGVDSAAQCAPENPEHCATPTPSPTPELDPLGNDPPAGEPPAIAGEGYEVKFFDSFNTLDRTVWSNGIWYEPQDPAGSQYVQDGVLHLDSKRSDGYAQIQATTRNTYAVQEGYIECRGRFNSGRGGWQGCWMLSQNWSNSAPTNCEPNLLSSEIDILEAQAVDPFYWIGAVHRHSGKHVNFCGGDAQNDFNAFRSETTRLADAWHTWAAKWTASQVCWYVDDRLSHCAPTYDTFANNPQFLILQSGSDGWRSDNQIAADSPDVLKLETNWVRVWQKLTP